MIKAIIFDCFGVLVTDALSDIAERLRASDPEKAERIVGLVHAASMGNLDATTSRTAIASELGMSVSTYADTIRNGEVKNIELLRHIEQLRNTYKTALLSNVLPGGLAVRFPDNELSQYFDVVVASGEIGFAKPQAQAYEITASRLGVRLEECVMIDDREDYCEGARSVGMQAILYQSLPALRKELAVLGIS